MERETGLEPATSSLGSWHSSSDDKGAMPNPKKERNQTPKTTKPGNYLFEYDMRYSALKSGPPTLAKLSLRSNQLQHERVEIPRIGTGTRIVRLKGSYTGLDGDLFLRIEGGYADVSVVHHGLQFPIWWGDSEALSAQSTWLVDFLSDDPLSILLVIPKLEDHLAFIRQRGCGRPSEELVLLDLISMLRDGTAPRRVE